MQECWIETPRGRVYAARWEPNEAGSGLAPIVLLHDSLGCVALWRDFPARLAQATGRSVVAYDRLGFGRSDRHPGRLPSSFIDDEAHGTFKAVRDTLELERFALLGHSVGGSMAVVTAGRYPGACQALITQAAQAFVEERTRQGIRDARQAFAEPGQLERLRKYHGEKAPWVLSAWIDTWLSDTFLAWRLDSALARVTCPTLVIHGERDEYGSLHQPGRIASLVSGPSTTEILPNCGHVPHRECQETVLASVGGFLMDVNRPAPAPTK